MDWWGADAMADVFGSAKRSDVMSRIRSKGNKDTEQALMQRVAKESNFRLAAACSHQVEC